MKAVTNIVMISMICGLTLAATTLQWDTYALGTSYNSTGSLVCGSTPTMRVNSPNCTTNGDGTYSAFICGEQFIDYLLCNDNACSDCFFPEDESNPYSPYPTGQCAPLDSLFGYAQIHTCVEGAPSLSSTAAVLTANAYDNQTSCSPSITYQMEVGTCGFKLSIPKCDGKTGLSAVRFCESPDCEPSQGDPCETVNIDPKSQCKVYPSVSSAFQLSLPYCVLDPIQTTGYANTSFAGGSMYAASVGAVLSAVAVGML